MTRAKPRGRLGRAAARPLPSWARKGVGALATVPVALMVAAGGTTLAVTADPPPVVGAAGAPAAPTAPPSSPEVPEAPAGPVAARRITMAFTGDILIHERLWETAAAHAGAGERFDFRPLLAPVRPSIRGADLAICHLETPLSPGKTCFGSRLYGSGNRM